MTAEYKTKVREERKQFPPGCGSFQRSPSGSSTRVEYDYHKDNHPLSSYQKILTRGNPGWNLGPGLYDPGDVGKYANSDRGGNCDHTKYTLTSEYYPNRLFTGGYDWYHDQPTFVSAYEVGGTFGSNADFYCGYYAGNLNNSQMDALGTTLSSIVQPLRPKASLAQTLIELKREGLPSIRSALTKGSRKWAKAAAEDWLNISFGWMPLWNDLRSLSTSLLDAEALLRQFQRDSGRLVRRETNHQTLELKSSTTYQAGATGYPLGIESSYIKKGVVTKHELHTRETWFSGAFKYTLPKGDTLLGQLETLNDASRYILGLSFDPKTIWSVLGWSWLVDWVFNVGPVLENFTQAYMNNSVMAYGYMMSRDVYRFESELAGVQRHAYGGGYYDLSASSVEEFATFRRRQATPFGFGVTWTSFSPFQLSILASLGISHRRP